MFVAFPVYECRFWFYCLRFWVFGKSGLCWTWWSEFDYWSPEITDKDSFCVVEHLTPLKFNISGKCFSGPVQHTNLALINCPNSRQVVSLEGLDRCFSSEVGFLCPKNVLKSVSSLQWLGFAWNPNLKLSFPRNHEVAPDCDHIHPLIHLGGRYFLSTTSGTLTLNSGELDVSPLAVYNFPCNVSFIGMKTSLGTCPQTLTESLPLFSTVCSVGSGLRWSHPTGLASRIPDHPTAY